MANIAEVPQADGSSEVRTIFERQRAAYGRHPYPSYEERRDTLTTLERILVDGAMEIAEAIAADYGHRSTDETLQFEVFPAVDGIRQTRKHLKGWMRARSRPTSFLYATASGRVIPQPRGVVGIVAPWNVPLFTVVVPLTSVLAAGNRAMVKMATSSQHLCRLLAEKCRSLLSEDVLAILPAVPADEFSSLPFDHLVFTGSAETGRTVMRSAADNLTPVTLELGGKSPVIVCEDFDITEAASRILYHKLLNAGQACVAPDYVLVPEGRRDAFVAAARRLVPLRYPDIDDPSYTSIIDDPSYRRLRATLEDASAGGARIIPLVEGAAFNGPLRKFPPHLVLDVTDDMSVMRHEIFGPILPVIAYRTLDEALSYVRARERPLALYAFTNDAEVERKIVYSTMSGAVGINHCGHHALQHDLPFGGTGASGMGQYRGHEGFLEFSKLRPVFRHPRVSQLHRFYPPYTATARRLIHALIRYKR